MPRKIRRPKATDLDADVSDYLLNRSMRERSSFRENQYKAQFMALLEESGEQQEGGHRVLRLSEPILFSSYNTTGKVTEKDVVGIRRVRREATTLDAERAMALIKAKGLEAECTKTEVVLDEDAILAANFDEKISDAALATLYDTSPPTYAFYLVEGEE